MKTLGNIGALLGSGMTAVMIHGADPGLWLWLASVFLVCDVLFLIWADYLLSQRPRRNDG